MAYSTGRIFFLGAGFSAGAGIPLTHSLLQSAAKLFLSEAPGLFDRVCNHASDVDVDLAGQPDAKSFSRLCTHLEFIELQEYAGGERWSDDGCRETLALKYFLSKSIMFSTPPAHEIPEVYLKFAESLTDYDLVVTFNWDLLLESALIQAGKAFSYNFAEKGIKIAKLHGSVNWIKGVPRSFDKKGEKFGYEPIGIKEGLVEHEIFSANSLYEPKTWRRSRCLTDEIKPLIVLPGYGKAYGVRLLSYFWYRPEFMAIVGGDVSIIGLSVSQDDFIVESFFRYMFRRAFDDRRRIKIINPDPNVVEKFSELSGRLDLESRVLNFDINSLSYALGV